MPQPDAGIELMLDQLREMPKPDRMAVLARLSPRERQALNAHRRRLSMRPASPFSAEIAERVEGETHARMTQAARNALREAVARVAPESETAAAPRSLFETVTDALSRLGAGR